MPAASNHRPPSGARRPATPPSAQPGRRRTPPAWASRRPARAVPLHAERLRQRRHRTITRASGNSRVVLAHARHCRLADATYQCAVTALTRSPAARQLYDHQRGPRSNPHAALRALTNRLVGILHGYLRHSTASHEAAAWPGLTVTNHPHRRSCCWTRYKRAVLDLLRWLPARVLNPSLSVPPAGGGRR